MIGNFHYATDCSRRDIVYLLAQPKQTLEYSLVFEGSCGFLFIGLGIPLLLFIYDSPFHVQASVGNFGKITIWANYYR